MSEGPRDRGLSRSLTRARTAVGKVLIPSTVAVGALRTPSVRLRFSEPGRIEGQLRRGWTTWLDTSAGVPPRDYWDKAGIGCADHTPSMNWLCRFIDFEFELT